MNPELKAQLEAALQAATAAGDIDTVHAIAGILKKAAPAPSDAPANETDTPPAIDTQTTAQTVPAEVPTESMEPAEPPVTPGPLYTAAQTQLEAMYPGHELEDELPDAVVISVPNADQTGETFLEITVTMADDGSCVLGQPVEVQPPADEPIEPGQNLDPNLPVATRHKHRSVLLEVTGDKPPTEYRLWAFGTVSTTKGDFEFTPADAKNVMAAYADHGIELHFDYEHGTLEGTPAQPAPAAGWMALELRDDGLWLTNIRWTARAAQMLTDKEYRYLSPAFETDEKDHICKVLNVALTNLPATRNLAPLVTAKLAALEQTVLTKDAEIATLKREAFEGKLAATVKSLEDAGVPPAVLRLVRPVLAADANAVSVKLSSGSSSTPGAVVTAALLEFAKLGAVPRGERTKGNPHQAAADLEITLSQAVDKILADGKPGMRRSDAIIAARKQYPHLKGN